MTSERAQNDAGGHAAEHLDLPGGLLTAAPQAWYSQPTVTNAVPPDAPLGHPSLYFNRELSEVAFNRRVLWQAADQRTPLLERVRFLAIVAGNFDEFFQRRVGTLKRQHAMGITTLSPDGRTPGEQLDLVLESTRDLMGVARHLWRHELLPALGMLGIQIVEYHELAAAERQVADAFFAESVYPVLTPLAVDPTRPFPLISNLSLSLAVTLVDPTDGAEFFARIKVPSGRNRWVRLPGSRRVLPVERLVAQHVEALFPGMTVTGAYPFSVLRNAYLEHESDTAEDLIASISEALQEQRFAPVVRLDVEEGTPATLRDFLRDQLEVVEADVVEADTPLRLVDLHHLLDEPDPQHSYAPWIPVEPSQLRPSAQLDGPGAPGQSDIFSVLRQGDILVHHPYQAYDSSVLRLLREAAEDPQVLAIKQTLYRTADESEVVRALIRAARLGKQVSVLIEIQARFEEAANIGWGEALENVGAHVAYGVPHLKTHAKTLLVLRQEESGIVGYCHIATGNYNERTAQVYSDLSLLTSRGEIVSDLVNLFHSLTGYAPDQHYGTLLVAPKGMAQAFIDLIQFEIERQQQFGDGHIIAKMNGLDDVEIINALYRASQAGVRIQLIVRGLCRLRPGLPGYSDNITVRSIIGRFLEHDRSFYFQRGGVGAVYMGSADWRRRNLRERVEVVTPVGDPVARQRITESLRLALADNRLAWELDAHGSYRQLVPPSGERVIEYQQELMNRSVV